MDPILWDPSGQGRGSNKRLSGYIYATATL